MIILVVIFTMPFKDLNFSEASKLTVIIFIVKLLLICVCKGPYLCTLSCTRLRRIQELIKSHGNSGPKLDGILCILGM